MVLTYVHLVPPSIFLNQHSVSGNSTLAANFLGVELAYPILQFFCIVVNDSPIDSLKVLLQGYIKNISSISTHVEGDSLGEI